jgi:hypothetical protein
MSDTNKQTNITISGKLTLTVCLKDSPRRYVPADLQTEVSMNFGASIYEIEAAIDRQLADLRKRLLIACGKVTVEE